MHAQRSWRRATARLSESLRQWRKRNGQNVVFIEPCVQYMIDGHNVNGSTLVYSVSVPRITSPHLKHWI